MHFGRFIRHIGNSFVCHDSTEIEIKKREVVNLCAGCYRETYIFISV